MSSTSKTNILKDIMGSLSSGEATVLEKVAKEADGKITDTEDLRYPTIKKDSPSTTEKKMGLCGLSNNGGRFGTETLNNPGNSAPFSPTTGTENISVPSPKVESSTYLTKKAAIYESLNEATGIDLEKVAGDTNEESFLLKQAIEILGAEEDYLEKTAILYADIMYERFMARMEGN